MDDLEGLNFNINLDSPEKKAGAYIDNSSSQGISSAIKSGGPHEEQPSLFSGIASILTGGSQASSEETYRAPGSELYAQQSYGNESNGSAINAQQSPSIGNITDGTFLSTANNPVICIFHLVFKGTSLFCFIFLNAFIDAEIATFLIVVILNALDFWVVKNITGRLLVNLRWWSEIDEMGEENWIYESDDGKKPVGKTDSFVFWTALYAYPMTWGFFMLMDIFGFKILWTNLCIICFTLSFTNAQGYYYCQKDQRTKLQEFIGDKAQGYMPYIISQFASGGGSVAGSMLNMASSSITSRIFGGGTS